MINTCYIYQCRFVYAKTGVLYIDWFNIGRKQYFHFNADPNIYDGISIEVRKHLK